MALVPAVLMGDPEHFHIRSGSNPHTRNIWGLRKKVDLKRAKEQWHTFAKTLTDLGVHVVVLPPSIENPGSVFPANAGFLYPKNTGLRGRFYLSNLTPGRKGERPLYEAFLSRLGFRIGEIPFPFEGEADFIETSSAFLFTSGKIVKQRFVPRFGFPPYRRLYGFRSDVRNLEFLKRIVENHSILSLALVDEAFYHGDTALSPLGPQKEHLLAYLPALERSSQKELLALFKNRLIPLGEEDARSFAANGFQVLLKATPYFFLPAAVSKGLLQRIASKGVKPVVVDVSEFSSKGGGSVKCLLCDLGGVDLESDSFSETQKRFWEERSYKRLYF
ncbi:MAG: hypothetical protein HY590_06945 [Candidatus Omnitrophica bacterium]|nr:hypothetical protein [Candidatus Omnitrophota bacterium]